MTSESEGTDHFSIPAKTRAYNRILQDSPASAAFFGEEETDVSADETTDILFRLLDLPAVDGSKKEKEDRAKILKGLEEKLGCTKFSHFKALEPDTITASLTTTEDVSSAPRLINSLVYIVDYSKMFTVDDSSEMNKIIKEVHAA